MSPRTLYELLPAIHRIRDAALAASTGLERGPQEELLALFADEIGAVEENLEQLYEDLFIETCADWVTPYIGDLISYRALYGVVPSVASPRAEVADTIALRRRKGTALVLEQLARDVTGWPACAVEFFELLTTTQYTNHTRPHSRRCIDLRDRESLEWIGSAFETASRSVDVRLIESGGGRHNIPNVGVFVWRIGSFSRREAPAVRVDSRRYRVSPLNHDVPLYNHPEAEDDITHLAEPFNVPVPMTRWHLSTHLARHYGERSGPGQPVDNPTPSVDLFVDGAAIDRDRIDVCNLSDDGAAWAHVPPAGRYAIDPELGRIALPPDVVDTAAEPAEVRVTWHEGAVAEVGGGEYERGDTLPAPEPGATVVRVPDDQPNLAAALAAVAGDGVVEITDSGRYDAPASVQIAVGAEVQIRAANGRRPTLVLSQPLVVSGEAGSVFVLNGLLVTGEHIIVPAAGGNVLSRLRLVHTTIVPGWTLTGAGSPQHPDEPALECELPDLALEVERSIVGALRLDQHASCRALDSIIDATARDRTAVAGLDGNAPGGRLTLESCTVIGKVHAAEFALVSDSILAAELGAGDTWPVAVRALRKQTGCIRFSFVPFDSIVPRRYHCQPDSAATARRIAPRFTSLRHGTAAYVQLQTRTADAIRRGADSESEMGVYHHLFGPQRETNLRIRLAEYLRVGLRAGIFYES
ncbi:hypothetical protein P3H15_28180 [Rhodococcus sp. T2V]|uniref:hypothetical protein n=1 Tax=Rhodococcus sp. T2V TaxID=3034164 RepID=UPI0023E2B56B|nr:hypothetical protein [Rhodococcus sp. T2V]MDF3308897.1 hypothetical protein [Rhodococcus sp. T2V]